MRTRFALPALTLLAVTTLAGCATAPGTSSAAGLDVALAGTPATDASTAFFMFTDFSQLEGNTLEATMDTAMGTPLQAAGFLGLGNFGGFASRVEAFLPDPSKADATATSIGMAPTVSSRFTGVSNPAGAFSHVSAEGSALEDGTLIVRRGDHEIDMTDEEFPPSIVNALNVIWHNDDTVIVGSTRAGVESWVTGSSPTLAEHYAGVASCLGDVAAAGIASSEVARTVGDVAMGITSAASGYVQTLCVRTDAAEIPAIEERLATGTDQRGLELSKLVIDATVEDAGEGWVRIRTEDPRSSSLPNMFYDAQLSAITG